jgi:hypothetical protein
LLYLCPRFITFYVTVFYSFFKQNIIMKKFLLFVVLLVTASLAWGQTVAGWEVNGLSNYGTSPFAATTTGANTTVTGLTRGSGVTTSGTAASNAWGGTGFTSASLTDAVTAGKFFSFTIKANAGYVISLTEIGAANYRRSGTGPNKLTIQYSVDGANFTDITTYDPVGSITNATGNSKSAVALTGFADLQNVDENTTITFRYVPYGASLATGTFYINNISATEDLIIKGDAVLPVELTAFTATATDKGTALAWATASEENNRAFEVQRSANGRDFETIATVAGAGTTYEAQNYNYLDAQPLNGVNYYRLKQVDFDGSFELHRVVAVLFATKGNAVAVLPTEVTTQFDLVFGEALTTDAQVQIYNFGGQLLHSETVAAGNQRQTIDAAALAAGIYVVRVQNNGVSTAVRFVKL